MEIIIKSDDVKKYGNQLIENCNEFENYIKKFDYLIDSINVAWEGNDSLKYVNTMKEKYLFSLEKLNSILEEYGDYLRDVPDVYATLDEVFASKNIDV